MPAVADGWQRRWRAPFDAWMGSTGRFHSRCRVCVAEGLAGRATPGLWGLRRVGTSAQGRLHDNCRGHREEKILPNSRPARGRRYETVRRVPYLPAQPGRLAKSGELTRGRQKSLQRKARGWTNDIMGCGRGECATVRYRRRPSTISGLFGVEVESEARRTTGRSRSPVRGSTDLW
jgi:hypothetical protein